MADSNLWPPTGYANLIDIISGDKDIIPLMDWQQFLHDAAKNIVDWIPHHPPVHRRPVRGLFLSGNGTARVQLPLGYVGYDAVRKKVFIETNNRGGITNKTLWIDLSNAMPMLFQAIVMLPIDTAAILENATGLDQPLTGAQMIGSLYSVIRDFLAETGIMLPELPNTFSSSSAAHIVLPSGTYSGTNGDIEYDITLSEDMVLAPRSGSSSSAQTIPNVQSTTNAYDENLSVGASITVNLPPLLYMRDNIKFVVTSFIAGENTVQASPAELEFRLTNSTMDPITVLSGTYTYTSGATYTFTLLNNIEIAPGYTIPALTMIATTTGPDPAWTPVGAMDSSMFPLGIVGNFVGGVNGTDYVDGSRTVLTLAVQNTLSEGFSLLPSLPDLMLHNIPAMNLTQGIHTLARELVDYIPHHLPRYSKPVYANGVNVDIVYRVDGIEAQQLPDFYELNGKTLEIIAKFSDDRGFIKSEKLLEHVFGKVSYTIHFEATTDGADTNPLLASLNTVPIDKDAYLENAESFYSTYVMPCIEATSEAKEAFASTAQAVQEGIEDVDKYYEDLQAYRKAQEKENVVRQRHRELLIYDDTLSLQTVSPLVKANHEVHIIGYERGYDALVFEDEELAPASTSKLLVQVDVVQGSSEVQEFEVPQGYVNFTPNNVILAKAVAESPGTIDISMSGGPPSVTLTLETSDAYPWLGVSVTAVLTTGEDAILYEPGAPEGKHATLLIAIFNTSNEDVSFSHTKPISFLIAGQTFILSPIEPGILSAIKNAKIYSGDTDIASVVSKPLTDIDIHFASHHIADKTLQWQRELEYVGSSFDLGQKKGVTKYLSARLRYKEAGDALWHEEYTDNVQKVPDGVSHVLNLYYDATKKLFTIEDERSKDEVVLRLRSVLWFLLSLFMMVPV